MYLSPLPRPQPTRGRAAVTWPYLLQCSPPSPPPLTLLIRFPAPPFFTHYPPLATVPKLLSAFFFFLIQDANSSPVSKSTVKLFSCKRRKAGWGGGEQKQKGGEAGEGRERDRGGERYPSAELGLAAGGEAGSKVSSAAAGGSYAAAPARAPCPPGRRALAGAGRPAHCSQPPWRALPTLSVWSACT